MKKTVSLILAVLLTFCVALPVFAEGGDINQYEQAILDKLINNGGLYTFTADDIKQAENYFKTVDVTEDQSNEIIADIEEGFAVVKELGLTNVKLSDLSADARSRILSAGKKAAAVLGVSISLNAGDSSLTFVAADGTTIFTATTASTPVIKTTGSVNDFSALLISLAVVMAVGASLLVVSNKKYIVRSVND